MNRTKVFSNTKKFVSAFSVLNEVLKHKSNNKLKKQLLNTKTSYDRFNSILTSSVIK